jgi:hypothetical protein
VKGSGKLADGTGISFTSVIGSTGRIPVHLMLYSNTGSAQGWLQLNAPDLADGTLDWLKNPQLATSKNYNYKSGFLLHQIRVAGSKYNKAIAPILGLVDGGVGTTNARITFQDGGISTAVMVNDLNNITFRISTTNGVTIPANTLALGLKLSASTGVLSGGFTLKNDLDATDTVQPVRTLPRPVKFFGLIVQRPGINLGVGHFLLSEMPKAGPPKTTLSTSDILSGKMVFGPK